MTLCRYGKFAGEKARRLALFKSPVARTAGLCRCIRSSVKKPRVIWKAHRLIVFFLLRISPDSIKLLTGEVRRL